MSTSTTASNKFDGTRRLSPDEMAMRREDLLEQLREMLKTQIMSGADIAAELRVSRATAHDYLHRLQAMGEAQRTGDRRDLWTMGSGIPGHAQRDAGAQRVVIVPAPGQHVPPLARCRILRPGPARSCSMITLAWIDAAAALPDDDTLVLIALADREVWPAFRDYGRWCYSSGMPVEPALVTYWMHLPPAPGAVV